MSWKHFPFDWRPPKSCFVAMNGMHSKCCNEVRNSCARGNSHKSRVDQGRSQGARGPGPLHRAGIFGWPFFWFIFWKRVLGLPMAKSWVCPCWRLFELEVYTESLLNELNQTFEWDDHELPIEVVNTRKFQPKIKTICIHFFPLETYFICCLNRSRFIVNVK